MDADRSDPTEQAIATVAAEILGGAGPDSGLLLNRGDIGLFRSLDALSAVEASRVVPPGKASVAAHVEHLRYGFALHNRWIAGDADPFADADWSAAWTETAVTDAAWDRLRADFRAEAEAWFAGFGRLLDRGQTERTATVAEVAHAAYHLGAIRQMVATAQGPPARD